MEVNVNHNSAISPADCLPLIPQIAPIDSATGNTANQRMGDKIKPKSLVIAGTIAPRYGFQATNQVLLVRVMVLAQKTIKVGSQVLAGGVDTNVLLKPALPGVGADQVQYNGATIESWYKVNSDAFRVFYDKVFKLAPSATNTIACEQNDKSVINWSYRFKKNLPASFTFDEGNGNWVNNFAPFYCIGYAYADGTGADVASLRLTTNTYSYLEFEDA